VSSFIDLPHLGCPDLKVAFDPSWTTSEKIRGGLRQILPEACLKNSPPTASGFSVSLSHCPEGGLIAYCPNKDLSTVGVDIEVTSRINEKTVARISSQNEMAKSSDYRALWVGKEAVFKALWPNNEGLVVGDISVDSWTLNGPNFRLFTALCRGEKISGMGFVSIREHCHFSIFLQTSL